ncbi:uncharacterized protein SCHCODRAFT_01174780 [Schizophyllum commune H4-8]|nr:uncharacterized protein SCHCODRAFT_01174780 [Schizophyllum commune H4-8]KAI5887434.1 hypothetical protein SCHCODRAFT_01174780 [Schizophyllum commune H4-8]
MLLALPASPTQLDEETASLIAQLALADLDEMAGDFADQQLAFELQAEALETMLRNFGIDPVRAARQARQQLTQRREVERSVPATTSAQSPAAEATPAGPRASSPPRSEATTSHASTSSASAEHRTSTSSPLQSELPYSPPRPSEGPTMSNVISAERYDQVVPVYRYRLSVTDPLRLEALEEADSTDVISELDRQENYGDDEAQEDEEHSTPMEYAVQFPSPDDESEDSLIAPYRSPEHRLWWEPPNEDSEEESFEAAPSEYADGEGQSGDEGELSDSPLTPPVQEADWHPLLHACEPPRGALYTCEGCYDHTWSTESVDALCGHHFCPECVERLVRSTLTDETLFPLRCCGQPLCDAAVDAVIPNTLRAQYQIKRAEYVVAPADRVYCVNPRCSAFLGSGLRSHNRAGPTVLSCTACHTTTCAQCRQPGHAGRDCVQESTAQFDALVKEKQWQRCPSCGATVDRTAGCPHMIMFALDQQGKRRFDGGSSSGV